MNISYLLSVLELYLMKEKNNKLIIEVDNQENIVKISFSYSFDISNKTFVKIDKSLFFENINIFLEKIQGNLILEKEIVDSKKNYNLSFSNQRDLLFINFNSSEMDLIRSYLNLEPDIELIDINFEESYDQKLIKNQSNKLAFSMGFSNFLTIFLTAIWFLDIFMISLWIFKVFIK